MLFPDIPVDREAITKTVLALKAGQADVIGRLCVSRNRDGSFFVEGCTKRLSWNNAIERLLSQRKGRK